MSRNPHATNLRHHRQQIIADKRDRHLARLNGLAKMGGSGVDLASMDEDEILAWFRA